jgi:Pectate lyase superfamily protein
MSIKGKHFPFAEKWKNYTALSLVVVLVGWGVYALMTGFAATPIVTKTVAAAPNVTKTWSTASDWNSGTLSNTVISGNKVMLASAAVKAAVAASVNDTIVTNGSTAVIIDKTGNKWTVADGVVYKNGTPAGTSANVTEIAYVNGVVWQENGAKLWWSWAGAGWSSGTGTAARPLPSGTGGEYKPAVYVPHGSIVLTFNASTPVAWHALTGQTAAPGGTSATIEVRTITKDATWSAWTTDIARAAAGQYIQLQVVLATTKAAVTPVLTSLTLTYSPLQAVTPTVAITANSTDLTAGQATIITWSSANATTCTASGAWRGTQVASGSISTGKLAAKRTYTLNCSGEGRSVTGSATVSVSAVPTRKRTQKRAHAPTPGRTLTPTSSPAPTSPATGSALAACAQPGQAAVTGATNAKVRATIGAPSGDMASAIQSAINSASSAGGGIVLLGAGTYQLDSRLTMASGVELEGAGENSTTLQMEAANTGVVTTGGASNTTIADLTVDQNGQNLNSTSGGGNPGYYEVMIDGGANNIVQQVQLINPVNYMLDEDNNASAFCMRDNTIIVNGAQGKYSNNAYANLDGIHIDGGTNGDIVNNYIDERENGATDGDDALVAQSFTANQSYVEFINNVARGGNNGDCMQFALGPDSISGDTVSGNELWGCPFGIRTGGYASSGSITSTVITNNNIHNLVAGSGSNGSFPDGGNAIELGGFLTSGQSSNSNSVINNFVCSAGNVVSESGASLSGTKSYSGCTDAATTSGPPPHVP